MTGAISRCTRREKTWWWGESFCTSWCTLKKLSGTKSQLALAMLLWMGTTTRKVIGVAVFCDELSEASGKAPGRSWS